MIRELNEFLILAGLIAIYWAATELGFLPGRSRNKDVDESDKSHVSALQASLAGVEPDGNHATQPVGAKPRHW